MHELPEGLSNSLRSFRGSIYGSNARPSLSDRDLEKGHDDYGEKTLDGAFESPVQSSVVLHPTHSSHALRQQGRSQAAPPSHDAQYHYQQLQQQQQAPQDKSPKKPQSKGSDNAVAKRQATIDLPQTPATAKRSLFTGPKIADPDPAADRLDDETTPLTKEDFYELMGMKPPIRPNQLPKHLGRASGLYSTIHSKFDYVQYKYRVFDVFTYIFLALQILLSAVFIVLGSLPSVDSHVAIAVLGAVSTVIAGILALMKGQGLPNRLRQVRDDLRNVLFESDELYWDVAAGRSVYFKDIRKIREDYLRVMEEARNNHPDTWTRTTSELAKGFTSDKAPAAKTSGTAKIATVK